MSEVRAHYPTGAVLSSLPRDEGRRAACSSQTQQLNNTEINQSISFMVLFRTNHHHIILKCPNIWKKETGSINQSINHHIYRYPLTVSIFRLSCGFLVSPVALFSTGMPAGWCDDVFCPFVIVHISFMLSLPLSLWSCTNVSYYSRLPSRCHQYKYHSTNMNTMALI